MTCFRDILYTFRHDLPVKIVYRKGDYGADRKMVLTVTKTGYEWSLWYWHYRNRARSRLAISVFCRTVWHIEPGNNMIEIWLFNKKDLEDDS